MIHYLLLLFRPSSGLVHVFHGRNNQLNATKNDLSEIDKTPYNIRGKATTPTGLSFNSIFVAFYYIKPKGPFSNRYYIIIRPTITVVTSLF